MSTPLFLLLRFPIFTLFARPKKKKKEGTLADQIYSRASFLKRHPRAIPSFSCVRERVRVCVCISRLPNYGPLRGSIIPRLFSLREQFIQQHYILSVISFIKLDTVEKNSSTRGLFNEYSRLTRCIPIVSFVEYANLGGLV